MKRASKLNWFIAQNLVKCANCLIRKETDFKWIGQLTFRRSNFENLSNLGQAVRLSKGAIIIKDETKY